MNGVWLDFIALIISLITIAVFVFRKTVKNEETIIYKYLIVFGLLFSLNSFFSHFLLQVNSSIILTNIVEKINFVFFLIILFLFTWYSFSINNMNEKTKKNLFYMFFSLLAIVSTLILLVPVSVNYHLRISGISSFLATIGEIFYFISIVIFTACYFISKNESHMKGVSLLVLLLLFSSFLIFNLLDLEIITKSYIISFTLLAMLFTLEKNVSEEKENVLLDEIKNPLENILQLGKDITMTDSLNIAKNKARKVVSFSSEALKLFDAKSIKSADVKEDNFDIEEFFKEIINSYKLKMQEKELEFSYNITPDLPKEVFGDKNNLQKVVISLLDNAYEYTDTGYVHLEISCVNTGDNCRLIIAIEDSGCGIKEDNVNKIFENNSSLEEAKQLVESLKGRIIVHTIHDEGSKFTVVVNLKIISKGQKLIISDNFTDVNYEGMKVIVVDDNADNLKIIKKLLERFLIKDVIYLDNGYDLIDKMKDNYKCDVVLLDINMSDISGLDTFNELKEIKDFSVPVVALLANEMPGREQKYIEEGFFAYLTKPIQKDDLTEVLEKIKSIDKVNNNDQNYEQEIIEPPLISAKDYLKKKGVDIDKALELLGDLDMYNETLKDFLTEVEEKWMNIEKYKLEENMDEYAVLVHSLKSDCKYLGFMRLADISYQHELSSKANDSSFVNKNFPQLEEEFNKVLSIAKDYEERYIN